MRSLSDMSRPSPLALLGMTAAVALCWFTGLTARRYHLSIGDGPYRDDFFVAAGSGVAVATVLALGLVALAVLRAPWWLMLATAAAAAHHVVLSVAAYQHTEAAPVNRMFPPGPVGDSISDGMTDGLMPGSWPLFVVMLAAAVALLRPARTNAPKPLGRAGHAGIVASFLLASLTGLVGWYLEVYFIFEGEPEPADFQNAIATAAGTAGLILLGGLVVWRRWGTWSHALPAAFGLLVQAFVVLSCLDGAQGVPDPGLITPGQADLRFSLEYAAWIPTSWPLVALLVLALVSAVPPVRRTETGTGRVNPWSHRPGRLEADAS